MRKLTWKAAISASAIAVSATISTLFAAPTPENTPDYFVDWVRSRSNLYVDTGVAGKVGVKAEVSFYYIQHDTYPVMLGAWGAEKERFNLVMHENKRCRWEYGHYDSGKFSNPAMTGMDSNGVNVSMDTEYGTLCDVTVECSATGAMSSTWTGSTGNSITATMNASEKYGFIDTQATLFLFAAHRKNGSTDGPSQYAYGILRSCKLWTDYDGTGTWTPARDLRPCVKNGRAGLYDAVTEEILYPQGNELEAGPAKLDSGYALGSNAHPGTQWGRIDYRGKGTRSDGGRDGMGNSQWMHLLLTDYTAKGAGDIANLNGANTSWQGSNLKWSQVRFDGWFQVSSDKAGTWKINQKYDDYFAIFIDGRNVLFNNSYTGEANSTLAVTEGWHRFTIIAGDTYGGYGCGKNYSGLGSIPFSVSVNDGAAMAFNTSNFPQGSGSNSYTLTSDEDWSDRGPILLSGGAVLDLNGHNLVVKDIACDDFVGSCITNSASKKSVLYFAGEPLETKAYVDSLIKEVDVKIILAQDGDQVATWTGAVSGDPANANNWEDLAGEPVVPTASYTVKIAGNSVNLQAPAGTDIACKTFEIGNCTLAADCDWRGLSQTPLLVGTMNLNGHVLKLNHLSANAGSTFSGGDGSAVEFVPSEAATYDKLGESVFIDNIANLTLSGSAKILVRKADGAGTLTVTELDLGKTHYAELVQTNGAVNLGNTWSVVGGKGNAAGHGVYRMTGGTLTADKDFTVGSQGVGEFIQTSGNVTLNNWFNIGRNGGRGTYTITGGAMTNTYNNTVYVGAEGGTGTINIGGDASVNFYRLTMGGFDANGNKGYINLSGNGSFVTRNWGTIGTSKNGYGEVNQSGGLFSIGAEFTVGELGTGVYNLTDGELRTSGHLWVGRNATTGKGTFTQGAGTVACNDLRIGEGAGSVGTYTQNDGMVLPRSWERIGMSGVGTHVQNGGTNYFARKVDNWLKMGETATGVGTYTLNDGLLDVFSGIVVGISGTASFTQNAGMVSAGVINIATSSGGVGSYTMNGGEVVTASIVGGAGTSSFTANGAMVKSAASGDILSNIDHLKFGLGGLTLDTAGYNVAMATASGVNMIASDACTFTKTGNGTLTVNVLPPVGNMVVSNGTLALSATCDNTAPVGIAHRWSFNGNLTDSVTGNDATWAKGDVTYNEGGTAARLTGTAKDTSYIELGPNKIPSDSATFEFWATIRTRRVWTKLFSLGRDTSNVICFTFNRDSDSGVSGLDVPGTSLLTGTGTLAANTPYYIVLTFAHNADGSTTVKGLCLDATTKATVGSFERNVANWSLVDRVDQKYFSIGRSFWNDWDAIADIDEVRVWRGALDDTAIALSAAKGPDATAADIAEIVAATTTLPMERTMEIASGATLSIASGQTLTQPVVKGSGTIAGGALVVSDKIVSTVGECIEASGTIDLSSAKIELVDPENLASPFTFLKPTAGQTLTVTGVPTPMNLPKQWKVSVSANGTGRIVKRGFVIIVK